MTDRPTCPICAGVLAPLGYATRDGVTGERFDLLRCGSCGFARTHPTPVELDRYYPPSYRNYGAIGAAVLRRSYRGRVRRWRRSLPRVGVALEVGAGRGWMLEALREAGWSVMGSERTFRAASELRGLSGASVFVGDLEAIRSGADLDLIVMFHVLEHLADPVRALTAAANGLAPGGMIIVGVPNIGSWQARFARSSWLHLDVPRHLSHFTPTSIERALAMAGLRTIRIDFRSLEHDPLGWAQSFLSHIGLGDRSVLALLAREPSRVHRWHFILTALLLPPLAIVGLAVAGASWLARRGAVMEVWAARD